MLDQLRHRLLAAATCTLMLLVTLLLVLSLHSTFTTQREADCAYIQRMATLLIYQLEKDPAGAAALLATYEEEMGVKSVLLNAAGKTLYCSADVDGAAFQEEMQDAVAITNDPGPATSTQRGVFSLTQDGTTYNVVPATIISQDGSRYSLTLLQAQARAWEVLAPMLPRALLLWTVVCAFIAATSHLLLRRAFAPARAMQAQQQAFIAAASHELKSPLAVIMANADALSVTPLPPAARQHLATIDRECERLARLANDLLLLTAADAGERRRAPQPVDVDSLLIACYDAFLPLCASHGQTLDLSLPDAPLPAPTSDAAALQQILHILLDNAVGHTPAGTRILLTAQVTKKQLRLSVSDDGPGIAAADAPHIFERFYRADRAHSDKGHSGLGLAIAQTLAAQLGASLTYTPAPEGGACFTLALPLT